MINGDADPGTNLYPKQIYLQDPHSSGTSINSSVTPDGHEVYTVATTTDGSRAPIYVHTPIQTWRRSSQKDKKAVGGGEMCSCWCLQRLWLVWDGWGIVCVLLGLFFIGYSQFVTLCVIFPSVPSDTFVWLNGPLFHMVTILAVWSYLRAIFTDPGTVPLNNATPESILSMRFPDGKVIYKCPKCNCIKPTRAHHCSTCRRCIRKMDHHCPWINNCVGACNQKHFVLFTAYLMSGAFYAVYLCVHYFYICLKSEWQECDSSYGPAMTTFFLFCLIVQSLVFGMFTCVMFYDQLQNIWYDTTRIETLKKEKGPWQRHSRWANLEDVFGGAMSWRWFLPLGLPSRAQNQPAMGPVQLA